MSNIQRSFEVSPEEREAAKQVIAGFQDFLKKLWAARRHDQRLVNVLEKNPETDTTALFEQRHLLRRFQKEVKERYTNLIFVFAGKKTDGQFSGGVIHLLRPLEKDTKTRKIKEAIQDAMRQLASFMEEFIEAFEDFNNKDQISKIVSISKKADQLVQSIENIVERELQPHFEKNIIHRAKVSEIKQNIRKRARLMKLLGAQYVH